MAALRTRISVLFVILVVAALSALVGYQLAQSARNDQPNRSSTVRLLGNKGPGTQDRKKPEPPSSCYKFPGSSGKGASHDRRNPNCPTFEG